MRLKTILHRATAGALCLILCIAALSQTALAVSVPGSAGPVNVNRKNCTLTLHYLHPDVTVRLYRVADVDANMSFTMTSEFSYPKTTLNYDPSACQTAGQWQDLAQRLWGEVTTQTATVRKTADDGKGGFAAKFGGLTPGLYLVVTDKYTYSEKDPTYGVETRNIQYTVNPYLVSVPTWSDTKKDWIYDIEGDAGAKATSSDSETVGYMALKVWRDGNGNTISWPFTGPITLVLQRWEYGRWVDVPGQEREVYSWHPWCCWENLDGHYSYRVRESYVLNGYTSSVSLSNANPYTFVVTNTKNGTTTTTSQPPVYSSQPPTWSSQPPTWSSQPPTWPTRPPQTSRPPDTELDDPDVPLGNRTPPPGNTPPNDEIELDDPDVPLGDLPQTGQLWWPVPVLAVSGAFLLLVGLVRRRGGEYDDE